MRHHALAHRLTRPDERACWSPDSLLREIQITLAALADIELEYERHCERIERLCPCEETRTRLRKERARRRSREREPHLQKLDGLQDRLRAHLTSGL
jgi:hypothetical protein